MKYIKKIVKKHFGILLWYSLYKKFVKDNSNIGKDFFVLAGTPQYGNLGDHAITIAANHLFKDIDSNKKILEIPEIILRRSSTIKKFRKIIKDKTIFIMGGGYIGSLWFDGERMIRNIVENYKNNKIIILPQTLYFENNQYGESVKKDSIEIFNSHPDLWICAREKQSYQFIKKFLPKVNTALIPDMGTFLNIDNKKLLRKGVLFCLRSDKEKILLEKDRQYIEEVVLAYTKEVNFTDTVVNHKVIKENRMQEVNKKLDEFSRSRLVITDRLHGMIFAAITGTPCLTLGNCSNKVKGVYEWIKNNKYIRFIDDISLIKEHLSEMLKMGGQVYDKSLIIPKYEELKEIILLNNT